VALNRAKVLETADKLVRQGKLEEAIKHYMVLSEDNPRDVNTINRIGDLFVRLRRNKDGIKQFMRIADFYAGDGFHLKAIAMYKKITKLEPAHLEANERLADMYAKQGMTSEARTQFVALAEQCLKASQRGKAMDLYGKVLAIEPGNVKVRLIVAEIHAKDGDAAKACEGYLAVVAELKKRGMSEEALKVLQKASRLQPSHPEILGQMAELLQAAGKHPGEALSALESLHKGDPGNLRYLQLLGEAYLGAGKTDAFEKLHAAAPAGEGRVSLLETEARFLAGRQETAKAVARLQEAAADAESSVGAERTASLLETAHNLAPGNAEILEKILAVWSQASSRDGMVSTLERLAQHYAAVRAWDRVSGFVDRLLDLAPESAVGKELRAKLEEERPPAALAVPDSPSEEAIVPSLDELERVVELDAEGDGLDLAPPEDTEPSGDLLQISEDDEIDLQEIHEQEEAYSGKSVIQEMRNDIAKPEIDEEFLSEHFTEAEVFLKYGLVAKAREQLQTILERYPEHIPSLGKMKEVLVEEARKPEAAAICMRVAGILRGKGEGEKAAEWEEQAKDLEPGVTAAALSPSPIRPSSKAPEKLPAISAPKGSAAAARESEEALDLDLDDSSTLEAPEEEMSIELVDDAEAAVDEDAITDRISQLEFSIRQGLSEEAEEILKDLEAMAPAHPEVERVKSKMRKPAPKESTSVPVTGGDLDMDVELAFKGARGLEASGGDSGAEAGPDDGFFDLAAELKAHAVDSTPDSSGDPLAHISPKEEVGVDEIFKAFRKKVDQQVEEEDYETRYNLGIAYKEMGLLDEAIGEFQYASRDPKLFLECCSILGICFREKGMSELAVKWYRKALDSGPQHEEKCQGLRYDLGELHAERGEYSQALSLFSEVYGVNSNYREVASKIRELKKRVG
jgi:tetratricopeptide (TPR) repeat protein